MPITSCGTTCPGEMMRSYVSSMIRRLTSTATGSFQSPSVISATTSAGTSPSFTTSVRHPWTIIFP